MLNEDKIKLMTDISFYEKKVRKSVFPADKYFKKRLCLSKYDCQFFSLYLRIHFIDGFRDIIFNENHCRTCTSIGCIGAI